MEVLVKKQETEHQHIISGHHKEMQELRDKLKISMERCEALSKRNEQDLKEFKESIDKHLSFLSDRVLGNELILTRQVQAIATFHKHLNEVRENYLSKLDMEKLKKDSDEQVANSTKSNLIAFQECQSYCKMLFDSLKEDLDKLKSSIEMKIQSIADKSERHFIISLLDKEGVLKELERYKKDVFIIEKKIENIYTLIERINKREGS